MSIETPMLVQDIQKIFNPADKIKLGQSNLAVDVGLGNPEISLVKLILGENLSWLPNNPIRTALLVAHEACNKYVGELFGGNMGKIILDPDYFPIAAKVLNKISPEIFGLDNLLSNYGSPITTEFHQVNELQRVLFTASPNILMPMTGYMVIEGATRIQNPILRRVVYGVGISMALEPLISIIPSFVDYTITSPYVVMDYLAGLAGIKNFEIDALPFALCVIGATALAYGPGRKLARKFYNTIFEKKEKNIIDSSYISSS